MKKLTALILTLALFTTSYSQKVTAAFDSKVIEFANQTYLRITVQANKGDKIYFPVYADTIANSIEVVKELKSDTLKHNPFTVQKSYLITSFEDSIHQLPQLPIVINNDTLYTPPLKLYVNSLKIDSAQVKTIDTSQVIRIFDIKPNYSPKFTFKEFWVRFGWLIILLFLSGPIGALIYILIDKLKHREITFVKQKPKEPAHVIAFRQLAKLKEKQLYQQNKIKEYYSELTDILRLYIENRFEFPALERTSTEIISDFYSLKVLENSEYENLRKILNTADLAKFAKYQPSHDTNALNFELCEKFVQDTKLEEQPVDDNENTENKENSGIDEQKNN